MYKFNMHAHTRYSDGHSTMEEMALEYKNQGFSVAVVTDHIYSQAHIFSNGLTGYIQQLAEAYYIYKKHNYPVIVGCEYSFANLEEVVVIGTDANIAILKDREERLEKCCSGELTIDLLKEVRKEHECFVSLCHPQLVENSSGHLPMITSGAYTVLDAYEQINGGCDFSTFKNFPKEFDKLIPLSNSDAHSHKWLNWNYNLTTKPITSEESLFKYIKDDGKFDLFLGEI